MLNHIVNVESTNLTRAMSVRIEAITVNGLFGNLDHYLHFTEGERISIIFGPNGVGKTIVLRIVNVLFNQSLRTLARLPFEQLILEFDDNSRLTISRKQKNLRGGGASFALDVSYKKLRETSLHFTVEPSNQPNSTAYASLVEDMIPSLSRVAPSRWFDARTGETLDLDEVAERYSEQLPRIQADPAGSSPPWFQDLRQSISVGFIDTERLTHAPLQPLPADLRRRQSNRPIVERTVLLYAADLKQRIQHTLSEYGAFSQSLDRTFPTRVVEEPSTSNLDIVALRHDLADVETKRAQLVQAGLLAPEQGGLGLPLLDDLDPSRLGVLAVYARDATEKLGVFDDLLARIDALKRIANSRLLQKSVNVGPEGLAVMSANGSKLELDILSSGEQHQLVILCELLFRVQDNSFILIDEPELSLHIAWQQEFLNDLEEIAQIANFRVLVATHSPQIIGERWDLAIGLRKAVGTHHSGEVREERLRMALRLAFDRADLEACATAAELRAWESRNQPYRVLSPS